MKLTDVVNKTAPLKKFTNYKDLGYKYKVVRIPALKDEVRSKKIKTETAACVNEMSRMMDCWKRTDFHHGACSEEIRVFMACMGTHEKSVVEMRERIAKGQSIQGSRLRPPKQVNEILAKYPQPKSSIK